MPRKKYKHRLSLKGKICLSLGAIALMLVISAVISSLDYRRLNETASVLVSGDIQRIEAANKLGDAVESYNLRILADVGDSDSLMTVNFDQEASLKECAAAIAAFAATPELALRDTVLAVCEKYIAETKNFDDVISMDFSYVRHWYFITLQPLYNDFTDIYVQYEESVRQSLVEKTQFFESGLYRSLMPGIVAVGAGLLLIVMLGFFLFVFYANPLYRMLDGLQNYSVYGKNYNFTFDGDDQLTELNAAITEIITENFNLKRLRRSTNNPDK